MTINELKLTEYQNFFQLIPDFLFKLPHKTWLIPSYYNIELYICLHSLLFNELNENFEEDIETIHHINNNMLYMIDSNYSNIQKLSKTFGKNTNIFHESYFTFDEISSPDIIILEIYDNWENYVKHAIHSLNDYGNLLAIIPSLWINKKHSMFHFLTQFEINYLKFIDNKSIFYLQKKPTTNYINIFDLSINKYIRYFNNDNISRYNQNFIYNLLIYTKKLGYIFVKHIEKKHKFKKDDVKMVINDSIFLIPNIQKKDVEFLNKYYNSNFVKYILISFNNNIICGLNSIPNILKYKNDIKGDINQFAFKIFNISIHDINNINNINELSSNKFNINLI